MSANLVHDASRQANGQMKMITNKTKGHADDHGNLPGEGEIRPNPKFVSDNINCKNDRCHECGQILQDGIQIACGHCICEKHINYRLDREESYICPCRVKDRVDINTENRFLWFSIGKPTMLKYASITIAIGIFASHVVISSADSCTEYNYHVPRNLDGTIYRQYCSDVCVRSYPKFTEVCRDDPIIGDVKTQCTDFISCLYGGSKTAEAANYIFLIPIAIALVVLIIGLIVGFKYRTNLVRRFRWEHDEHDNDDIEFGHLEIPRDETGDNQDNPIVEDTPLMRDEPHQVNEDEGATSAGRDSVDGAMSHDVQIDADHVMLTNKDQGDVDKTMRKIVDEENTLAREHPPYEYNSFDQASPSDPYPPKNDLPEEVNTREPNKYEVSGNKVAQPKETGPDNLITGLEKQK
ncbi:unnamed protein product [Owenia fusiformis]|uniref:Uncharacterized protein n=1 Tax=Owenia fusiformis TaxID=6347 RepID=A0A8J1UKT1_OWEFU|nr:unnamed protein product [Owenia fusiformis]